MKRLPAARSSLLAAGLVVQAAASPGALPAQTVSLIGGVNVTVMANVELSDRYDPFDQSVAPNLGVGGNFRLSPPEALQSLWVQLSAVYAPKGAVMGRSERTDTLAEPDDGIDFQLDYVDLALLADMRFPSVVDGVFIHFLVGPSLGVLLSCDVVQPGVDDEPPLIETCIGEEGGEGVSASRFRRLDSGVVGGVGLEFSLAERVQLHASAQWTIGLEYIDVVDEPELPALKNRAVALRAALAVPLG